MSAPHQFGLFLIANNAFNPSLNTVFILVELIAVNRANEFAASARKITKRQSPAPNTNRVIQLTVDR